jgi:hypothetical protein
MSTAPPTPSSASAAPAAFSPGSRDALNLTRAGRSTILRAMKHTRWGIALAIALAAARAGADEKDLKRRLESQRSGVEDLVSLDAQRAASEDIALLKTWLDEAWTQLAREEEDTVRMLLDRCDAQSVHIREGIEASKARAAVDRIESALRASRAKVEKTRRDLQDAQVKKKALEMNLK